MPAITIPYPQKPAPEEVSPPAAECFPLQPCPWCGSTAGESQEDWEPWPRCLSCGGN